MRRLVPALSLRLRLTLLWSLVSLGILICLEVLTLTVLGAQLNSAVDRELGAGVRGYREAVAGADGTGDLRARTAQFLARQSEPGSPGADAYYRITLSDGTVLTNSREHGLLHTMGAAGMVPGQPGTVRDPGKGDLRMATVAIEEGGRPVGELRIAFLLQGVQATIDDVRGPLLVVGLALICLVGLVAWALTGRALAPVRRITATAAAIGEGDLSRRIAHRGPRDEVGSLAATFDEMLARLQSEFEQRQSFYALASHELRTPLTVVRGHLEVLSRAERPPPEEVKETLELALDELGRITDDVNDMLLMGRMLLGQRGPLVEVDAASLIADVYRKARRLAIRDWQLDVPEPVPVVADAEQLERAVLNLVVNAAHHTAEGDRVRLACHRARGWGHLEIADTGEGIPAAHLPAVFDPWFRAGDGDGEAGGLGLMIVREVVRAHGGHIQVASRVGEGTTFTVCLPLAPEDGRAARAPSATGA